MRLLTHSQIASLNRAILRLYEPLELQHFHERAFEAIRMVVVHDVAGFTAMSPATKAADSFLSVPAHRPLLRSLQHLDDFFSMPGVAEGAFFSSSAPTSMHDYIALDAFKGRAIYEFFYKEVDILYDLCLTFHSSPRDAFCALQLGRKRRFSPAERRVLQLFQPHVGQRYRQLLADNRNHPLASHMARPVSNWILCDGEGRIRERSPRVQEILRRFSIGAERNLPEPWMGWFRRQCHPAPGVVPGPLVIPRKRQRLTVHCLPNRICGEHRLIFEDRLEGPDALTSREREIAGWLAEGKTNAEIGEILGASRFTVKNHVQHILAKLGTENRTAAAAAIRHAARRAPQGENDLSPGVANSP